MIKQTDLISTPLTNNSPHPSDPRRQTPDRVHRKRSIDSRNSLIIPARSGLQPWHIILDQVVVPWTLDYDSSDLPSFEMNKLNFAGVHRLLRGSFAWLWWGGGFFTLVCLQIPKAYFLS